MTLYKMPLKSERSNQVWISLLLKPSKVHEILEFSNFFRFVIKPHCYFHTNSMSRCATIIISRLPLNTKMSKTLSKRARITSLQFCVRFDIVFDKYIHFQCKALIHHFQSIQQIIPSIPQYHDSIDSNNSMIERGRILKKIGSDSSIL